MAAALFKPEQTITQYTYESAGTNTTTVSRQLDSSRWLSSQTVYDGFERVVTASHNVDGLPAGSANFSISTSTIYDGLGRAVKVSNPYRPTAASTDGWARTAYDLAGRALEMASFAGAPPARLLIRGLILPRPARSSPHITVRSPPSTIRPTSNGASR